MAKPPTPKTNGGHVVKGRYYVGKQHDPDKGGTKLLTDAEKERLRKRLTDAPWDEGLQTALPSLHGSPGIVVDEGEARATPCTEVEVDPGQLFTFSKGVVGPLDGDQRALYCTSVSRHDLSPAQRDRLRAFQGAADSCRSQAQPGPDGDKLQPWLACMAQETRRRGVELT